MRLRASADESERAKGGAIFLYLAQRVVGVPFMNQWGDELQQWVAGLLQAVDTWTWETWRWVLLGSGTAYVLTAAKILASRVKKRGPDAWTNGIVLANFPGALVVAHFLAAAGVLALAALALFGICIMLRAAARSVVPGVRAARRELELRRERRERAEQWLARPPQALPTRARARMMVGEFGRLDTDLPPLAWHGAAAQGAELPR